ncbi:MAG: hypothetical protein V4558_06360 [Gemmatimonadota bacterium]
MKFSISLPISVATLLVVTRAPAVRQPHLREASFSQGCITGADESANMLGFFRAIASSDLAENAHQRLIYKISKVERRQVKLVATNSVCAKAAVTINRDRGVPDSTSRSVILIKIDTIYIASDPAERAGEYGVSYRMNFRCDSILARFVE